jgi:hypothetical protein
MVKMRIKWMNAVVPRRGHVEIWEENGKSKKRV